MSNIPSYVPTTLPSSLLTRAKNLNVMLMNANNIDFVEWVNSKTFGTAVASLINGNPKDMIYSYKVYPFSVGYFVNQGLSTMAHEYAVGALRKQTTNNVYYLENEKADSNISRLVASYRIPAYYNDFRDDYPNTKIYVYLPFIKTIEIDATRVIGKTLQFVYYLDLIESRIMCKITDDVGLVAQEDAPIGCDIPLEISNLSDRLMATAQITGSVGTAIASGGVTAPLIVSNTLSAVRQLQPSIKLGEIGSGFLNFYSTNQIHIIVQRPKNTQTTTQRTSYVEENGLPCENYYSYFDLMYGNTTYEYFTSFQVEKKDFADAIVNLDITDNELDEFVYIMNNGVYIPPYREE